ncbi:MAG TPA: hypothetical protein VGU66_21390 [Candidatus Elarobacter sp.]|nr:hypothetical protein [Candidatus Elarobacter sp.]
MRVINPPSIALLAAVSALFVPIGAPGADAPAGVTVTVTRVVGAEAVTITGNGPAAQPLEASLYATFSRDIPDVLLSRRAVPTDARGHYSATLPIASAFFRGAVVTVVVRSLPAGPSARTTFPVGAPNVSAPPDDLPQSVR